LVPLCRVTYEGKTMKTTVKANAGGTVAFDETLSFSKQKDRHIIKARSPRPRYAQIACSYSCLRLLVPPYEDIAFGIGAPDRGVLDASSKR
jgi:hypothetical protein